MAYEKIIYHYASDTSKHHSISTTDGVSPTQYVGILVGREHWAKLEGYSWKQ